MENIKWRRGARTIAWIHIIFASIALIWAIVTATLFTLAPGHVKDAAKKAVEVYRYNQRTIGGKESFKPDSTVEEDANAVLIWTWIVVAVWVICTVIEFYAAIKLLSATKITATAKDSLKNCKIWCIIMVVMTILGIANNVYTGNYYYAFPIGIIVPLIFLFVVARFMMEVKELSKTQK